MEGIYGVERVHRDSYTDKEQLKWCRVISIAKQVHTQYEVPYITLKNNGYPPSGVPGGHPMGILLLKYAKFQNKEFYEQVCTLPLYFDEENNSFSVTSADSTFRTPASISTSIGI